MTRLPVLHRTSRRVAGRGAFAKRALSGFAALLATTALALPDPAGAQAQDAAASPAAATASGVPTLQLALPEVQRSAALLAERYFRPTYEDPCRSEKLRLNRMLRMDLDHSLRLLRGGFLSLEEQAEQLERLRARHEAAWAAIQEQRPRRCGPDDGPQVTRLGGQAWLEAMQPADFVRGEIAGLAEPLGEERLAVGGVELRLHGIELPRENQACILQGQSFACGRQVQDILRELVAGRQLTCGVIDFDRLAMPQAVCRDPADRDIAMILVLEGWAFVHPESGADYLDAEIAAETQRRGLWAGDFQRPHRVGAP